MSHLLNAFCNLSQHTCPVEPELGTAQPQLFCSLSYVHIFFPSPQRETAKTAFLPALALATLHFFTHGLICE